MSQILGKVAISMLLKFATETFLAKLLIESLKAWAKTTDNELDDKVVEAMAEALGVEKQKLLP